MSILLGAIADDFTGATDLANTLVKEGMRVVQVIGVPDGEVDIGDAQAVVVALKSRTIPVDEAVDGSTQALKWLRKKGARQIVQKYCSTFDSTQSGNIGPVADALLNDLGDDFALVCPAFPENHRTVYQGHLFVGPDLLSDSSMKDHPLTPMRDANLIRLLSEQSQRKVGLIPLEVIRTGPDAITRRVETLKKGGISYGVADAIDDGDLRIIGCAARDHTLVTGGSGVATGLPENFRKAGLLEFGQTPKSPQVKGREIVLAGSCSVATRRQIASVAEKWPTQKINIEKIALGGDVVPEIIDWALARDGTTPILIYASADPEEVAKNQERFGMELAGEMAERTLASIAAKLTGNGFTRLIVAGGETSGAVVSALGVKALRIGPEIAPGVPWTETLGHHRLAIALKSGNFGGPEFFEDAFAALP